MCPHIEWALHGLASNVAAQPESRTEGTITSWDDDRAFGFITPTDPGPRVFVHLKAFRRGFEPPRVGQLVEYQIGENADGKQRAEQVQQLNLAPKPIVARATPTLVARRSNSYLAIPAFILLYFLVQLFWQPPIWVVLIYVCASLICYVGYWLDKAAAVAGGWRVAESTLLIPGLLGGWPGAILGQQIFRHKTKKNGFRVTFWTSVVLNVTVFVLLTSPPGQELIVKSFEYWTRS